MMYIKYISSLLQNLFAIGVIGISIQSAAAIASRDQSSTLDFENSETNFKFKQKLKNTCSGFTTCANTAAETLVYLHPRRIS